MFWGIGGVLVIGINRQDVLPFLQVLSLFFIEDDGSVLRLILPPDVSVNLVAVQINMKSLSRQNRDTVGIEVEVIYFKSGTHEQEFFFAPC
jgi:hypothetical protein